MKKILLSLALLGAACAAYAQDAQSAAAEAAKALSQAPGEQAPAPEKPKYWTTSAVFDLGFNQTNLWSWAAGGYNTLTLSAGIDGKADYAKDLMAWTNRLQLNYGFLWSADKSNLLQKSTDRIYLESKLAYKTSAKSKWNYTASFDFRSQFTDSYDTYVQENPEDPKSKWTGTLRSGFFSPAYTNIALGLEWKPNAWFNMNVAPVTGGMIFVLNESLRANYGMHPINAEDLTQGYHGALFQFGAQIKINAKATLNDKFFYDTQLVLFTDYLDNPFVHNRVNWDNKFTWQATKFFKVDLNTWLIYDPIVNINGVISKVQFKEFFAVNFTYTIKNKK